MSQQRKSGIDTQLREIKNRLDPMGVGGAPLSLIYRVRQLHVALLGMEEGNDEFFRYFPVAAIAILESYVRAMVASTIDHAPIYLSRGLSLIADRSLKSHEAISVIQSGAATAGQLIAHLLPFSAIGHIESSLDTLLGTSFKEVLKRVIDPFDERNKRSNAPLVVADVRILWRKLEETFRLRHILAHEAAVSLKITKQQAEDAICATMELMQGLDAALWHLVWRDVPLTQAEMNEKAYQDMRESRMEMAKLIRELRRVGKMDKRRHRLWRAYFVSYMADDGKDLRGSMRLLLYALAANTLLRERLEQLKPLLIEGSMVW